MKKVKLAIWVLILMGISLYANGQNKTKYWIFFKDKGESFVEENPLAKGSKLYSLAEENLSRRAILRRSRRNVSVKIDYLDLPVNGRYVAELKKSGVVIENSSKWLNAVTAYLDDAAIQKLKLMEFIKELKPVAVYKNKGEKPGSNDPIINNMILNKTTSKYNYGLSLSQNQMINIPKVHDLGIDGTGVVVGMLDTGFDWRRHSSLNKLKVLSEYDFVFKDSVTANQQQDIGGQDTHGTLCFSILGGFAPDTLIGPSYNSEFILGKTEDMRGESIIEEDNWAAGIEWMENLGVDVVSSSLGYNQFNDSIGNHTYKDMDGATTLVTKVADIAVTKGVVVVVSAGNEGTTSWKYITAPADGKYVIAVGAANSNGSKASFSSFGPTYDGRIKPDVSALGVSVYHAVSGTKSSYSWSSGTSVACPLVAGVASMILSARPDLTPAQVTEALRMTAGQALAPDNQLGWGVIDAYKAVTYYGIVFSNKPQHEILSNGIKISTYIASKYVINKNSVKIYYSTDNKNYYSIAMAEESNLDETNSGFYSATLPVQTGASALYYYITATDEKGERRHPYNAPSKSFEILKNGDITTLPDDYLLYQNYPNPFNPGTEIKFNIKQRANVSLKIYNSLGQLVTTLMNKALNPDSYSVSWNGLDNDGKKCSSGLYYYRLDADKYSETKKMMLIK